MALSMSVTWCVILTEILISTECAPKPKLGHAQFDPLSLEAAELTDVDQDFLYNDSPTLFLDDKSTSTKTTEANLLFKNTSSEHPKNTINMSHIEKLTFDPAKKRPYKTKNYEKYFTKSKINKILTINKNVMTSRHKKTRTNYIKDKKIQIDKENTEIEQKDTRRFEAAEYNFNPPTCKIFKDRVLCGFEKNIGEPIDSDEFVEKVKYRGHDCIVRGGRIECDYYHIPRIEKSLLRTPTIDSLETSTINILDTAAMAEITTETTESIIKTNTISITSQITLPETTQTASQRNASDTFTITSSINVDAPSNSDSATNTPSGTDSQSDSSSTETDLAASPKTDYEATTGTINNDASSNTLSSTSNSPSSIDIKTYIPSGTSSCRTSSSISTEPPLTEKNTESIGMICVEKGDRIVCY